ncbi:hypothetical protein STCU_06907 [Strigomonas culicis]|nr:hypothetical protein STCU_06907 [Strigomonas culicis]|eukprot:EPY24982.1 hypothetical protein STCU_06907 [Strigomonas culicis]
MPMDGYHYYKKELQRMSNPRRAFQRRGAEWTFNAAKLQRDLRQLVTSHTPRAQAAPAKARIDAAVAAKAEAAAVSPVYMDVLVPSFDHGRGDPVEQQICIPASAGVVLVEGNYVLYNKKRKEEDWAAVFRCFHVRLFLDCDPDVCLRQLVRRHMRAWKVPQEVAEKRAKGSDAKNGDLVDTTKGNADVVLHLLPEVEVKDEVGQAATSKL